MAGDSEGGAYLSTRGGYFRFDIAAGATTRVDVEGQADTDFTAIARRADGKLVLGSADGAVYTLGSEHRRWPPAEDLRTRGCACHTREYHRRAGPRPDLGDDRRRRAEPMPSTRCGPARGRPPWRPIPAGRVLVADTRGDGLLVFGTDPLILRQRYPVPDAPYGLAGSSGLAWVSQTAANTVVGYDLATGIPVEKVRYRTVQQPNSLAFDEASGTLYVVSGSGAGVQVIADAAVSNRDRHAARPDAGGLGSRPQSDEYEWIPLRLPPDLTRISASTRLSIEAEYRGWELTRVRLYTDGSRRVLLRRKKTAADRLGPDQPGL